MPGWFSQMVPLICLIAKKSRGDWGAMNSMVQLGGGPTEELSLRNKPEITVYHPPVLSGSF